MTQIQAAKDQATFALEQTGADRSRSDSDVEGDGPALKPHAEFLATFTPEEEKRIMRKVDLRIIAIIGFMSMIRAVCSALNSCCSMCATLTSRSDRRKQRSCCQGSPGWRVSQYLEATPYDFQRV